MKIVVLALNPAIDNEWKVNSMLVEEKNTILASRYWAGGKGINVCRWLKKFEIDPVLVLPLGGNTGRELKKCIKSEGIRFKGIKIAGCTRTNYLISADNGRQMRFNEVGPELSKSDFRNIIDTLNGLIGKGDYLVLSGSLPKGINYNAYAEIIKAFKKTEIRVFLDCDGKAFKEATKEKPFLVKPNLFELGQWAGHQMESRGEVVKTALALSYWTWGWVAVSMGPEGAILVNAHKKMAFEGTTPKVRVCNRLGAGDAMLAGIVSSVVRDEDPEQWLKLGITTGTASTLVPGGELPKSALFKKISRFVKITRIQITGNEEG